MDISIDLAPRGKRSLALSNPVLTASGCFGNGLEFAKSFDIQRLGGIVSKGVTLRPRSGNPQLRIVETASGMLNSIGLQNIGVEALTREVAPVWRGWQVPVIVNIAGECVEDYAELASRLDSIASVSGLEVNISCPNVANGIEFGADAALAAEVTAAVIHETTLPVIVKLTPNVTDIVAVARAVVDAGADALTVINTFPAMAIDASGGGPRGLGHRRPLRPGAETHCATAGLPDSSSGPGRADHRLRRHHDRARRHRILSGGSQRRAGRHRYFPQPRAPLDVLEGIERYLRDEGITDLRELVGAAQPLRLPSD